VEHNFKSDTFEMDIKDCGIKMPAELSIRHSDISVGKGVTGKSAPPYETTQCSTRTEFSVLASPRPFSYFSTALHLRTSICTTGARCHSDVSPTPTPFPPPARCSHDYSISARPLAFPLRARCFPHAHTISLFARLLDFRMPARCFPHDRSLRMPVHRTSTRCFPHAHAHSHFCMPARCFPHARSPHCTLAVSRTPTRCFPHVRSPHCALAIPCAPARFLHARSLPRASSSHFPSASHFPPPRLAPLRLAGKAEPGAERDKDRL
jgi:hypothetical protein